MQKEQFPSCTLDEVANLSQFLTKLQIFLNFISSSPVLTPISAFGFASSSSNSSCSVTTTVHNIIVGKLWVDQSGDMDIFNHTTKDICHLKYYAYSYFSRDIPRKVTGVVVEESGREHYVVRGTWDDHIEVAPVLSHTTVSQINKE